MADLPGDTTETKETGTGATTMLDSRLKTGTVHPGSTDTSTETQAHMNLIFAHITLVVPGLVRLSTKELKKEDVSALQLVEQPSLDRQSQTGYTYSDQSNAAFRGILLKFVKTKVTSSEYNPFEKETELLWVTYNRLNNQNLRRSRGQRCKD